MYNNVMTKNMNDVFKMFVRHRKETQISSEHKPHKCHYNRNKGESPIGNIYSVA